MTCACGATFEAEVDGDDFTQRDKLERLVQLWGASHFSHTPTEGTTP